METISIIPEDNAVYVNGELRKVDCSGVDKAIHAVQWCHCPKREKSKGHIEWVQDPLGDRRMNTPLESMSEFQPLVDAWNAAPTEDQRHKRIRADKQVERTEALLAQIKEWPEKIADEATRKNKAILEVEAELVERKKQRDDVYAGRRKEVNPSGAL